MKIIVLSVLAAVVIGLKQDPCAGCDEITALKFQKCAGEFGDPCAELDEDGLVTNKGKKRDTSCCLKKEKHNRCLKCAGKDCEHGTCTVNKHYYKERSQSNSDKGWKKHGR